MRPAALQPFNDEGDALAGNFLLLERGGCSFSQKALVGANGTGVTAVAFFGCAVADGCDEGLLSPAESERIRARIASRVCIAREDTSYIDRYRRAQCGGDNPARKSQGTRAAVIPLPPRQRAHRRPRRRSLLAQQAEFFHGAEQRVYPLPNCLGGGTFPRADGTFHAYSGASSLLCFDGSNNVLANLPPSMGRLSQLRVFAASHNVVIQPFPVEYFGLTHRVKLDFYGNSLTLDFDHLPSGGGATSIWFGNMTQVQSILLRGVGWAGTLPVDLFDGCVSLRSVDLALNQLRGVLPSFTGCTLLQSIQLQSNQLAGGIPDSWAALKQVTYLDLSRNQLGALPGSVSGLAKMTNVETLILSRNNITTDASHDVGQTLFNMLGPKVSSVSLDHNSLLGRSPPVGSLPPSGT